ncbi:YdaU family protein [Parvularcula flava]|uniref:YdaU family protein n=1 Tax=Aquisalinus luteolus TaxID=1566827 RepID=A0A8J3EVC1_9PROT|nr:DUF1376 domain-containing protein [Aquisalinus luteolus]NHK29173.1 YdaU family protein [Aquisalinus luteolus]GGI00084.1 hypothetical protein GCM10011355_27540 [Aquisalinus luteolus]
MAEMPWFRFFPSDWLAGTRGMSASETGIYITLVATMYERCEPVPEDHARLARLCGATKAAFVKTLNILIDEGKIIRVDTGLWNERAAKEIGIREEKSEVGRSAAQARWGGKVNKNNDSSNANAMRMESERNANQKPDIDIPKGISCQAEPDAPADDWPDRMWKTYPARPNPGSKKQAVAKLGKIPKRDRPAVEEAIRSLIEYHRGGDPQYIPMMTTWLNGKRWETPIDLDQARQHNGQANRKPAGHPRDADERRAQLAELTRPYLTGHG